MKRFRNYVLMAAGFVVLVAVVGVFTAGPAIAQAVRAALVSNVDDPGRIPYAGQAICTFNGPGCAATLPLVPNGKRLVITHVSGRISESLPGGSLVEPFVLAENGVSFPVPTFLGPFSSNILFNHFVFSQSELLFAYSGQRIEVGATLGGTPNAESYAFFSLSG